jgi:hypothetical protein
MISLAGGLVFAFVVIIFAGIFGPDCFLPALQEQLSGIIPGIDSVGAGASESSTIGVAWDVLAP